MIVNKEVQVPAKLESKLDYIQCDLCEAKAPYGIWSKTIYGVAEIEVCLREGSAYPDGGDSTTYTIDICPECFKNKLMPWFVKEGGTIRQTESRW